MSLFSNILKGAGVIAPFFGPAGTAIGAGIGAVSGLIDGNKAQGQASRYAGMSDAQIRELQKYQQSLYPAAQDAIDMARAPAYNYQGPDPYSEDFQSADYNAYGEDATRAADAGVSSLVNDYARRGIVGGTGINQGIQGIRSASASDLARFRSQLRERGALAKRQQFMQAEDARFGRLSNVTGQITGNANLIQNGIGGQQSIAQSNANNSASQVGAAFGQIAANAGSLFGAGNNRTGTNQQGQQPFLTMPWQRPATPAQPTQTSDFTLGGAFPF